MKVLHVEAGRHLYGGAQQVLYLLEGLRTSGVSSVLACPSGCQLATAARAYAEIQELPMRGDLDAPLIARLVGLIKRCRPDIIHLHSRAGADVLGGLAARSQGVPAVLSRRVDNPEPRWLVAWKYRLFDRVIAISEGIGRVLLAGGLPPRKLRIVRSAVLTEPFAQRCERAQVATALGLGPNELWVGVVAQLIPRKGHRFLLAALPSLVAEFPQLRVIFFGQGPLADELQRLVYSAALSKHVRFAGFRQDLPSCLPCLDLLVHPATMEGLGVALLQAASAGVPIVASRVGGVPEAVTDGVTGLLVPPADAIALAGACRALLVDAVERRRMGSAGQARMRAEFSTSAMVAGNLAVYRELLSDESEGNVSNAPLV